MESSVGCRVRARASGHATVRVFVFAVDGHAREVQAVFCSALERGAERCETRSRRVTSAVVESRVRYQGGTARQADEIYAKLFLYVRLRVFRYANYLSIFHTVFDGTHIPLPFYSGESPDTYQEVTPLNANFLYGFGYAARAIASRPVSTRPDSMPAASSRYPRGLPESLLTSR